MRALGALGHQVTRVEMPGVLPAPELIDAIAGEVAEVHRRFREEGLPYGADVAKRVDDCLDTGQDRIEAGKAWQKMIRAGSPMPSKTSTWSSPRPPRSCGRSSART